MKSVTQQSDFDRPLMLRTPTGEVFSCSNATLLLQEEDTWIECRLRFPVEFEQYQEIDLQTLFNLKPDVRGSFVGNPFLPDLPVQLELVLRPDLLISFPDQAKTADATADYLLNLNEPEPKNPLLITESWFCLSVLQEQAVDQSGYMTLWHYIDFSSVYSKQNSSERQFVEGIAQFFADCTHLNLSTASEEMMAQLLEEVARIVEGSTSPETDASESLFGAVMEFFKTYDWPVIRMEGETALQTTFQGKNGQWSCYIEIEEEQDLIAFYSLCPVNATATKRSHIAELLVRINHGLLVGHFGMDWESGEIYCKTSLNIRGEQFHPIMIEKIAFANVMIMDQFLPGILAVLYGNSSPIGVIATL